ncbi:nitrite reductase [Acidobacteriota bacterium]
MRKLKRKKHLITLGLLIAMIALVHFGWSSIINLMMPADSRPGKIGFKSEAVNVSELKKIEDKLIKTFDMEFPHVERFLEAGINSYAGPQTCLQCHTKITVSDVITNEEREVKLLDNLLKSSHYRFFSTKHPNVYGYNGKLADNFPMGKINRPCPKPGSFAMTAWAEVVETQNGHVYSEGCGQCHIGGQYQAPLGEIMPFYKTSKKEKEAIDCLICHSQAYDMNKKQVVTDANGRNRWAQDRSLRAAVSVTTPNSQTCLRCHQHNFGGDVYVDPADPSYMNSLTHTGYDRPRVLHPGSKRGTPFSPSWDVHAAAGIDCIDCHATEGHLIAKGTHTTTMMANDLPDYEVTCEKCHSEAPHQENEEIADFLNMHTEKIACQTCHIPALHEDNATMRDFDSTVFEADHDLYIYNDIVKENEASKGIKYVWWNGDATFLGGAIGDNPNGKNLYKFYDPTHIWPEFRDYDYDTWYENIMRPIAQKKPSKLYAMKLFNGKQHIDLQNMGPFGGMFVPYNLPDYYKNGNPDRAAMKEMEKSMMKMMYGWMFKFYMMDKFMSFMDVDGWNTKAYSDISKGKNVDPRWIPQDAMMEISHAIRREGALMCTNCHNPNGVLDWKGLGYSDDEIKNLIIDPLK